MCDMTEYGTKLEYNWFSTNNSNDFRITAKRMQYKIGRFDVTAMPRIIM
jgi:hypothetical protein